MTFEKIFADLKKTILKADASKLEGRFAFQCCVEGDGEGTFYIAFEDGVLSAEPYDYVDNDGVFKASAETFKAILTGKARVDESISSGALKVEGNENSAADILAFIAGKPAKKTAKATEAKTEAPKAAKAPAKKPAPKAAAPKAEVKAEVKAEPKAEVKTEAKAAVKTEAKAAPKARTRKTAAKSKK